MFVIYSFSYVSEDDFFPPDLDFGAFSQMEQDLIECQSSFSGQSESQFKVPPLRIRQVDGAISSRSKIQIPPIPPSQPVLPEPNRTGRRAPGKRTPVVKSARAEAKAESSTRSSVGYQGDKSDDDEDEEDEDEEEDAFEYNASNKRAKKGLRHEDFAPPDPNDLDEVQRVERR